MFRAGRLLSTGLWIQQRCRSCWLLFLATLIRSTFGFGEGLSAVPLLAFIIPIGIAAPVVVLLSITVAAVVIAQDWRNIHVRSPGRLLGPTFVGIPLV
jgi:uncharacterized protein